MTIEAFQNSGQPKADWLFEGKDPSGNRTRSWQNSEHWWTALFSLLLLHLAKNNMSNKIPVRKLKKFDENKDCLFFEPAVPLDLAGLKFSTLAVEAGLSQKVAPDMFQVSNWPKGLSRMEPDITICEPEKKQAIFIENKTVRAQVGRLIDYLGLGKRLEKDGWKIETIVLISLGNSKSQIWKTIEDRNEELHVILWEDVLRIIDEIEEFRSFFDVSLAPYYQQVKPRTT